MSDCYIDTLSVYTKYSFNPEDYKWKKGFESINKNGSDTLGLIECWSLRKDNIYLRYFPNLFGQPTLYMAFSLPKVYNRSNNNCYNIRNFHYKLLDCQLDELLNGCLDKRALPSSILEWDVSRSDFFVNHQVPIFHKKQYMDAYSNLSLPRFINKNYKGTIYINSNIRKNKAASVVLRIYDKDKEMKYKSKELIDFIDKDVEEVKDFEMLRNIPGLIRIEVQVRRKKFIKYNDGEAIKVKDIFSEEFQKNIINNYIIKTGLNLKIKSKTSFRNYINSSGYSKQKRQNIIEFARAIRNKRRYSNVSEQTLNKYKKELRYKGMHIITSESVDLIPVDLL